MSSALRVVIEPSRVVVNLLRLVVDPTGGSRRDQRGRAP
jgi:hypothetical protein